MKKEYKVTSYHPEVTEEEKEEIYKQIADIFIRMAQKDFEKNNKETKEGEQMKRKIDKNKVYQFIGQAVVYTSGWALGVAFFYWAFLQRINLLILKERR